MKLPKGLKLLSKPRGQYQIDTIGFGVLKNNPALLLGLGLGKCVHPDTLISTNRGPLKIKDLWDNNTKANNISKTESIKNINNIEVKCKNENDDVVYEKINKIYRQNIDEKLIKIKLNNGEEIITTKSHKFYIFDGYNLLWKNNPKIGDYLPSFYNQGKSKIDENNIISEDFAKLLGWQIAEAYEDIRGTSSVIYITQNDTTILEKLKNIFINEFGNEYIPKIYKEKNRTPSLRILSKKYTDYLIKIGYKIGKRSANKEIPKIIFKQSLNVKSSILRALFDGEAYVGNTIEFTSKSKILIFQIQYLLSEFGIYSYIKEKIRYATNTNNKKRRKYYYLYIPKIFHKIFRDNIGFSIEHKSERLNKGIKIKSNTNIGIPTNKILKSFKDKTKISGKNFGVSSITFEGLQGTSKESLNKIIDSIKHFEKYGILKNVKIEKNYRHKNLVKKTNIYKNDIINLKYKLSKLNKDFILVKIVDIKEIRYKGYVYDLEVNNKHNFMIGNYVAHNTFCSINICRYRIQFNKVNKVMIICPTSITRKWKREISKFSEYEAIILHDEIRKNRIDKINYFKNSNIHFGIINYEGLYPFYEELSKLKLDYIVADESARYIKNHTAQRSTATVWLGDKAKYRSILTGTLIANKPLDTWMQFRFLNKGKTFGLNFYSWRGYFFKKLDFGTYKKWVIKKDRIGELSKRIYLNSIRYTTKEVFKDLPEVNNILIDLNMNEYMKKTYEKVKSKIRSEIETECGRTSINIPHIFTKLIRLQQVTSGYIKDEYDNIVNLKEFIKLDAVVDEIKDILETKESVIVWCKFRHTISLLENMLKNIKYIVMTGDDNSTQKDKKWNTFQKSKTINVFIGQIESGGIGIELFKLNSTADYQHMIFVENTFVLDHREQAIGRSYGRIGQNSKVRIVDFIFRDTIDEKIYDTIMSNKKIADEILKQGIDKFIG